ncbi:Histone acetyltransferase KAT2B, partial [Ophiophagus hannah]
KAQLRSAPRAKKLEKLGVYSACKIKGLHRRPAQRSPHLLLALRGRLKMCGSGSLGLQPGTRVRFPAGLPIGV